MQTLVYIIGGYCLIKAVFLEVSAYLTVGKISDRTTSEVFTITAFLFLAAIEAFNQ